MWNFSYVVRRFMSTKLIIKPKICIVGAGPAGFYAAQHLIKKLDQAEIDIFERLPVPFGLVRFGVAPDHPEVKNVINTFTKTAKHQNIRFFGNVSLGKEISLEQLRSSYHVVLLSYGAEENRQLNIPGEFLQNVIPARKIVGWYNGFPNDVDSNIDLSAETVCIFGQGNVAIDVARILLSPIDELKKTDITQYALEKIAESKIKRIYLIGRRGPLQAAYTIKELRELLKLRNCLTSWSINDFSEITDDIVNKLARPKKRIMELMLKSIKEQDRESSENSGQKVFNPIFFRSPLNLLGQSKVEKVILGINVLQGDDILNQKAVLTDVRETLDCKLVISSIGYKSIQADSLIPFDESRGVIKNNHGKIDTGLYTTGWLATGPVGVILTTMSNAFGIAERIIRDISEEKLINEFKPGFEEVKKILDRQNVQIVDWSGWEKIDAYEVQQGKIWGKPREKVVNIEKMIEIAYS